jgi:deoxyribodipyrimidine photo-lyase
MTFLEKLAENPRVTVRTPGNPDSDGKCIVYWMQRAHRALDNPALDLAIAVGNELRQPVVAYLAPMPFYPNANWRHYEFLRSGIADIAAGMAERNVGFVLRAYPDHHLAKFCEEVKASVVIGDENPMREPEQWRARAASQLKVPLWTVDADVIVPSRLLKRSQFAARTIRPRLQEQLSRFLPEAGTTQTTSAHFPWSPPKALQSLPIDHDWLRDWEIDRSVSPVSGSRGGASEALGRLNRFVGKILDHYPKWRNHPELAGTSQLSPYLHFGHMGPITVARAVQNSAASAEAKRAFLDQLITWRELAVNLVKYSENYDSMEVMENWAKASYAEHARDSRPVLYSADQLENAETHDPLWNAGQKQMVITGWMHNYLRMYWAKKILEWSPSVAEAYRRAIWLNDRYQLDGRDPNGYEGIAWAIVGKHDRAWFDRPIFGKVRYMSYASTSKKFNSNQYVEQIRALETGKSQQTLQLAFEEQ